MSALAETASMGATSPGLWTLAWRRLRADRLAMVSLAVVGLFLGMLVLSYCDLIAADWEVEAGVSYAPPTLFAQEGGSAAAVASKQAPVADNAFDPLAEDLRALRAAKGQTGPVTERAASLPFGADKWGHDVLKKTIKGGETSIVVGLVAALLAVSLGTVFGAVAGFYGGLVDDLFNWFYNIFTAIPAILMILAVAAVLQHKGVMTIVLILGLTGWTGPFRLIREAPRARLCAGGRRDRRVELAQDGLAYLPQYQPRRAGAAVDPGSRLHQGRSDPVLPRLWRAGRRCLLGQHAQRSAE